MSNTPSSGDPTSGDNDPLRGSDLPDDGASSAPPPPPPPASAPPPPPPPQPGSAPSYGSPTDAPAQPYEQDAPAPSYGQAPPPPPPSYGTAPPPPPAGYGQAPAYAQVPVGKNKKALWSTILGAVGILLCGIVLGPVAIILSRQAKKEIAASGGQQSGAGLAKAGLILGIVALVLWALGTAARLGMSNS